jgi:hypothetical protein
VASNWLDTTTYSHHVPTAADDVLIGPGGGPVTIDSDVGTIHSLTAQRSLSLSAGALTIASASSVLGPNFVTVAGGVLTLGGTGAAGQLTITNLVQSGGTITGPGDLAVTASYIWFGGLLDGPATATLSGGFSAFGGPKALSQRTLKVQGTGYWNEGDVTLSNGAQFVVDGNGTLGIFGPVNVLSGTGGGSVVVNPGGTLNKSDPTLTQIATPFSNNGIVTIQSTPATLQLSGAGPQSDTGSFYGNGTLDFNAGVVNVTAGQVGVGNVTFTGANFTMSGGSYNLHGANYGANFSSHGITLISAGSATFNIVPTLDAVDVVGGALILNQGTMIGDLALSGGALGGAGALAIAGTWYWTGGTLAGPGVVTIGPTARLVMYSSPRVLDTQLVNASPIVTWIGGTLTGTGSFTNLPNSTFVAAGDGTFAPAFDNQGTFTRATNSGTLSMSTLSNSGSLQLQSGLLQLSGPLTQTAGGLHLAGGTLQAPLINLKGGTLDGTGTLTGDVTSGAAISPGPFPGIIAVNGNYTQTASGVLDLIIGGTTPGLNLDQLEVSGKATLGGTLNLITLHGLTPGLGDVFTLVTFASSSGIFATITGLSGAGFTYVPVQGSIGFAVAILTAPKFKPPAATAASTTFKAIARQALGSAAGSAA